MSSAQLLRRHPVSRAYHFASSQFAASFGNLPDAGPTYADRLRRDALAHVDQLSPATAWATDPVCTLLKGQALLGGTRVDTHDAFGETNGAMVYATDAQVAAVLDHLNLFDKFASTQGRDLRQAVRAIESDILAPGSTWAAALVGNQAVDFGKQDGVTEMVETVEASAVERRLADALADDEATGVVRVCRAPAIVTCVSNFSNFLDLSRKVLRNLELGVPVLVLSRSNTAQHSFRWAKELVARLPMHGLDPGLVTFLAAPLATQKRVVAALGEASPLYFTGSRAVAADMRAAKRRVFASTGGPNTLVATQLTPEVAAAIQISATLEHAGQCTALRHAVVPCAKEEALEALAKAPARSEAVDALRDSECAALLFANHGGNKGPVDGGGGGAAPWDRVAAGGVGGGSGAGGAGGGDAPAAFVRHSSSLPPVDLDEHWRVAAVDFSAPGTGTVLKEDEWLARLSKWLVDAQPIAVAVNDEETHPSAAGAGGTSGNGGRAYAYARALFERTSVVVFTVGTLSAPALTCQARPQVGEVFGEVPPRRELGKYTCAPVIVPSPTPAYNSVFTEAHLEARAREWDAEPPQSAARAALAAVALASSDAGLRGLAAAVWDYLQDACAENPKKGTGGADSRTTLYGLQNPPRGARTYLRLSPGADTAALAPILVPFAATSAAEALWVSACDGADAGAAASRTTAEALAAAGVVRAGRVLVEGDAAFEARVREEAPFDVIRQAEVQADMDAARVALGGLPLAGQVAMRVLCFGHAKSAKPQDEAFVNTFAASPKWLKMATT